MNRAIINGAFWLVAITAGVWVLPLRWLVWIHASAVTIFVVMYFADLPKVMWRELRYGKRSHVYLIIWVSRLLACMHSRSMLMTLHVLSTVIMAVYEIFLMRRRLAGMQMYNDVRIKLIDLQFSPVYCRLDIEERMRAAKYRRDDVFESSHQNALQIWPLTSPFTLQEKQLIFYWRNLKTEKARYELLQSPSHVRESAAVQIQAKFRRYKKRDRAARVIQKYYRMHHWYQREFCRPGGQDHHLYGDILAADEFDHEFMVLKSFISKF